MTLSREAVRRQPEHRTKSSVFHILTTWDTELRSTGTTSWCYRAGQDIAQILQENSSMALSSTITIFNTGLIVTDLMTVVMYLSVGTSYCLVGS